MKAKSRRQFTSTFKAKVVLEVLRQEKTFSQIASENELHPAHPHFNQIRVLSQEIQPINRRL